MDPLWGLRALEDLGLYQPPRESPHPPEAGHQDEDTLQTPNNVAEAGHQEDDALQAPNNVAEPRVRAVSTSLAHARRLSNPCIMLCVALSVVRLAMWPCSIWKIPYPVTVARAQCSQMRPPVQLWAFPPVLSIADRAFLKPFMDYQRDLRGNASQSLVDLDRQLLSLNTVIDFAEDQCNRRLACIIIGIVSSGDVGTPMAKNALTDAISTANEKIDYLLAHISQSQRLHTEAERIGRELNATATKEHTALTMSSVVPLVGLIKWFRRQFYDSGHKKWNRNHTRLSEIHEAQACSNQTGQRLARIGEATQRIRRQLRRLSDRTQNVPEGEFTQSEDWFWGHVAQRFAEAGKPSVQSHRDAVLRDLEQWCSQCSGAST
ncbi:MAG: hypothetical protein LQ337_003666 [Flavoplaca oasis]|nr:MAG: hypothetical protein LQ337_003666 [Flavoplaca oasis]